MLIFKMKCLNFTPADIWLRSSAILSSSSGPCSEVIQRLANAFLHYTIIKLNLTYHFSLELSLKGLGQEMDWVLLNCML
jgi:hypothetical protein